MLVLGKSSDMRVVAILSGPKTLGTIKQTNSTLFVCFSGVILKCIMAMPSSVQSNLRHVFLWNVVSKNIYLIYCSNSVEYIYVKLIKNFFNSH